LVRYGLAYQMNYGNGYTPEQSSQLALKQIGLPSDFKRDDYQLICDGQSPADYGLVEGF